MNTNPSGDVTQLLRDWSNGDSKAGEVLLPLVYGELRQRASSYLRRERSHQMLQATDLVHEVYLRLVDQEGVHWRDRLHFFALAATTMRRILVDHARARLAGKRGGDQFKVSLLEGLDFVAEEPAHLLALDDALTSLRDDNPQFARIVELRFFGGFNNHEIAELLEVSMSTITRRWRLARAWLFRRLSEERGDAL